MLDKRKQQILQAIVDDYISTAEPIGSRTIARKYDLGISSATIRNEMADLELLGYLGHLHTSSGRVPSSKGYRFYVDDLLKPVQLTEQEISLIRQWYDTKVQRLEGVFQETAKIISHLTNNVSLVISPQLSEMIFQNIRFIPLDEQHVIAVVKGRSGYIENKIIRMPNGTSLLDFQQIAAALNAYLQGKSLRNINMASLKRLRASLISNTAFDKVINAIGQMMANDHHDRIYTEGATQLMEQPEFRDLEKVRRILLMLEEEPVLRDILYVQNKSEGGLSVTIGQENKYNSIKDCSVVRATYNLDGRPLGTIAVLGPTRMQYGKIITLLGYMNESIAQALRRFL